MALAVVAPLAVSLALIAFRDELHPSSAGLVLVVIVLVVAVMGGRTAGLVAALTAAACFDFFFTQPYYSFTISSRDDIETTVVLLIVGVVVGEVAARARRFDREARRQRAQAQYLQTSAALLAGGESAGYLIRAVERELVAMLDARAVQFERPPLIGELRSLRHGRVTVPSRDTAFPFDEEHGVVEIRVFGGGTLRGRFVVELGAGRSELSIDPDQRAQAIALVDQLGGALASIE